MKTLKELKKHESKLGQAALDYLNEIGGDAQTHHVMEYMADCLEELIGKEKYRRAQVNCMGVIDGVLRGLKDDGLVKPHGAMVEITRKGRFVKEMRYSVFAILKNIAVLGWVITGLSKIFTSFWGFAGAIVTLASILASLLLRG